MTGEWLPLIWFLIIGFGVFMYVVLDGFVLGIGILVPFAGDEAQRDTMMNSAAPIWDGNETWLVLGGAGLLAAFPKAYAVMLSALYLPVLLMLIALVFRGVSFEFRFKAGSHKGYWTVAFWLGSAFATFAQGLILGALVMGIDLDDAGRWRGGAFDWLSPFPIFTGLALVATYGLLGSTWLVLKTEHDLQDIAYRMTKLLLPIVIGCMLVVSVWVPFLSEHYYQRWFTLPNLLLLLPIPAAVAINAWWLWRAVLRRQEGRPFWLALGFFALGYLGLVVGFWPYLVPPDLTYRAAASAPESQAFVLVGTVILLPIILGYTAYSYRAFRGKVRGGYH